jgi:hypothetical protein
VQAGEDGLVPLRLPDDDRQMVGGAGARAEGDQLRIGHGERDLRPAHRPQGRTGALLVNQDLLCGDQRHATLDGPAGQIIGRSVQPRDQGCRQQTD